MSQPEKDVDPFVQGLQELNVWRHVDITADIDVRFEAVLDIIVDKGCTFVTSEMSAQHQVLCGILMNYDGILEEYRHIQSQMAAMTPLMLQKKTERFRAYLRRTAPIYTGNIKTALTTTVAQLVFSIRQTFDLPEEEELSPAFDLVDALTITAISGTQVPIDQLVREAKFFTDMMLIDCRKTWNRYPDLLAVREHLTNIDKLYNISSTIGSFEKIDDIFASTFDVSFSLDTSNLDDQRAYQDFSSKYLSRQKRKTSKGCKRCGGGGGRHGGGGKKGQTNLGRGNTAKSQAGIKHSWTRKQRLDKTNNELKAELRQLTSETEPSGSSTVQKGIKKRVENRQSQGAKMETNGRRALEATVDGNDGHTSSGTNTQAQPAMTDAQKLSFQQETRRLEQGKISLEEALPHILSINLSNRVQLQTWYSKFLAQQNEILKDFITTTHEDAIEEMFRPDLNATNRMAKMKMRHAIFEGMKEIIRASQNLTSEEMLNIKAEVQAPFFASIDDFVDQAVEHGKSLANHRIGRNGWDFLSDFFTSGFTNAGNVITAIIDGKKKAFETAAEWAAACAKQGFTSNCGGGENGEKGGKGKGGKGKGGKPKGPKLPPIKPPKTPPTKTTTPRTTRPTTTTTTMSTTSPTTSKRTTTKRTTLSTTITTKSKIPSTTRKVTTKSTTQPLTQKTTNSSITNTLPTSLPSSASQTTKLPTSTTLTTPRSTSPPANFTTPATKNPLTTFALNNTENTVSNTENTITAFSQQQQSTPSRDGWTKTRDKQGNKVGLSGGNQEAVNPTNPLRSNRQPANQGAAAEAGGQQGGARPQGNAPAGGQQGGAANQGGQPAAGTNQGGRQGTSGNQQTGTGTRTDQQGASTGSQGTAGTQRGAATGQAESQQTAPANRGSQRGATGGTESRQHVQQQDAVNPRQQSGQSGGNRQQQDAAEGTSSGRGTGTIPKLQTLRITDDGDTININTETGSVFEWAPRVHLPSQSRPATASQPLNPNAPSFVPGQERPGPFSVPGFTLSEPPPRNILAFSRGNKIIQVQHEPNRPPKTPDVLPKQGMRDSYTQMTYKDHPQKPSGDYADVRGMSTLTEQLYRRIKANPPPSDNTPVHPHFRQFMDFHDNQAAYAKQGIFFSLDQKLTKKFPQTPLQEEPKFVYQRPITRAQLNAETPPQPPIRQPTVAPPTKTPRQHTPTERSYMEYDKVYYAKRKQLHHHRYDPDYNPPSE